MFSEGGEKGLPKLTNIIDTAVKNFAAADRLDFVIRLEHIAPDLFLSSHIVTQTMLQAIGSILLADVGAPKSWTDMTGPKREIYKTYRTYADRAELTGYLPLYLVYEVLLSYIERRSADIIGNLIKDIDSLMGKDVEYFVEVMTSLASSGGTIEPTRQSDRIVTRVTEFLCEYKEQSNLLRKVSQQAALQC